MLLVLYAFLILFWLIEKQYGKRGSATYLICSSIAILLVMGLRNMAIYGDTLGYVTGYCSMESMSLEEVPLRWIKDPCFYIVSWLFGSITGYDYTYWLLFISASYIIPIYFFFKKYSAIPMLSWIAFIFIGLLFFTMAGLRQTVAMGLTLTAFLALMNRKDIIFFLLIFAAYLIHGPSLIILLIYPIVKWAPAFSKRYIALYLILFVAGIIIGNSFLSSVTDFLGEQDARFIGYNNKMHGANYTYFIQQFLLATPSLYILRNRWHERNVSMFAHISMISMVFASMSPIIAEMFRVSMYFSWAILIIFPMAMNTIKGKQPIIPTVFLFLISIYLIFINKSLLEPYFFWFEDSTSFINSRYMDLDLNLF